VHHVFQQMHLSPLVAGLRAGEATGHFFLFDKSAQGGNFSVKDEGGGMVPKLQIGSEIKRREAGYGSLFPTEAADKSCLQKEVLTLRLIHQRLGLRRRHPCPRRLYVLQML
jgi:hypothetical protein